MPSLRAIVVDDEPLALERVRIGLEQIGGVTVVATAKDGVEAVASIRGHRPDLVFLDIEMPGCNGFDVVKLLAPGETPFVIFVTAFSSYAAKAFEVSAVDYVLKPVEYDRLRIAVARARERLAGNRPIDGAEVRRHVADVEALRERPAEPMIWAQRGRDFRHLPLRDVDRFEADRDFVQVHAGGAAYLIRGTMAELEGRYGGQGFLRVHRSHLIRASAIAGARRSATGLRLTTAGGVEIPVGRKYAVMVKQRLVLPAT